MAIALIASASAGATAANTITTGAVDMTGADLLVIASGYDIVSGTTKPTESDSQSNSYADLDDADFGATAAVMHYAAGPSVSASHTFTSTVDGTFLVKPSVCAAGFSGLHATPFDVEVATGGTSAASVQAASLTPTVDGCLLVTTIVIGAAVSGMTLTGGGLTWTILETVAFSSGNHQAHYLGYAIQPTAAAITVTWDWTTNAVRSMTVAAFKPAAGAATKAPYFSGTRARTFTRGF